MQFLYFNDFASMDFFFKKNIYSTAFESYFYSFYVYLIL